MPTASTNKSERAMATLRRKIVGGQWRPGAQLPTRPELERDLGVSRMTLQRVMDQLLAEGFIAVRGRAGTFVSERPPHRTRFALLAPYSGREAGSRFWDAMAAEARARNVAEAEHTFSIYYDIWPERRDRAQYEELVAQVRAHRFAGVIFASSPHGLSDSPVLTEPGLPRVVVMRRVPGMPWPVVSFSQRRWLERACERLRATGVERAAVVAEGPNELDELVVETAASFGIAIRPPWRLYVTHRLPTGVRHCAHLLMDGPADARPQAVLVMDDHLVEAVALGLADAGVSVPEQVQVIAHANFPYPPPTPVPVTWLGHDVREALRCCIDIIDRQRQGEAPPMQTFVTPVFEEELPSEVPGLATPAEAPAV